MTLARVFAPGIEDVSEALVHDVTPPSFRPTQCPQLDLVTDETAPIEYQVGSSFKSKLCPPPSRQKYRVFIIKLRRSGKVKGSDIGTYSPGLHSSSNCHLSFCFDNRLFLQVLQAGSSPTDAGSSRYASRSPKGESELSRRVMAVGLRLRVWMICCLLCSENVSHARFHGNTHRDLFDRRSFQTHCRRIIVPETELDLCRRTSSPLHRSEVEESRAGPRRSYLTLA
jgi:hypothetical protein